MGAAGPVVLAACLRQDSQLTLSALSIPVETFAAGLVSTDIPEVLILIIWISGSQQEVIEAARAYARLQ